MNAFRVLSAVFALLVIALGDRASAIPRPEHPEPQMVRSEWLNLNGVWEFGETNEEETSRFLSAEPYPDKIVVPFVRESKLSGLERKGFVKNVWYRRTFTVPEDWKSSRVRFHVGACDWKSRVWINGTLAGEYVGGSTPFVYDITSLLKDGENTVVIHAFDDTPSGLQPLGKQSIRGESYGIFYTPTTGIWQTVWLEGVNDNFIRDFRIEGDPATGEVHLLTNLDRPESGLTLRVKAFAEGAEVASISTYAEYMNNRALFTLDDVRPWEPGSPFLYDLTLQLVRGGRVIDEVKSYFGLRSVTIDGQAVLINGKPIFQRLVLDQGFYPDGIWTAPSEAALKGDIELSMSCGFNGARLHQKIFEPRFHYWADKLGYITWGEYPSYGADYGNPAVDTPILNEWAVEIKRDRNHPSIVGWCPFNEMPASARQIQAVAVNLTRAMDPSRPVIETSGWSHFIAEPMILDCHDYDGDPKSLRERYAGRHQMTVPARYEIHALRGKPFFISEYGGIGWDIQPGGWGYNNVPENLEAWHARFAGLAAAQLENPGLFGFCYTQLTDIEQEQNGVFKYDRKPKFDVARLRKAIAAPAAYEENPPTARPELNYKWTTLVGSVHDGFAAAPWNYTEAAPPSGWSDPDFDDSGWKAARAPFGKLDHSLYAIATPWTSDDIWLRQKFTAEQIEYTTAALILFHDDVINIYLNGKELFKRGGWNNQYQYFNITEALKESLVAGENTLAVHVHQNGGGQYFDLALIVGDPE